MSVCQILVKSTKANNSYSGFCEVTPKQFNFRSWVFVYNVKHKDLKMKCLGMTSQKPM